MVRPFIVCLLVVTCLSVAACGEDGSERNVRDENEKATEEATPRALAAGLLEHLAAYEVTTVGGSQEAAATSVLIGTSDPDLETLHLYVMSPEIPSGECGDDAFYEIISCETEPHATEVARRKGADSSMPILEGRFYSAERGNILVQMWGRESEPTLAVIHEVLSDELLGVRTSARLIAEGEDLDDFETLVTTVELH